MCGEGRIVDERTLATIGTFRNLTVLTCGSLLLTFFHPPLKACVAARIFDPGARRKSKKSQKKWEKVKKQLRGLLMMGANTKTVKGKGEGLESMRLLNELTLDEIEYTRTAPWVHVE